MNLQNRKYLFFAIWIILLLCAPLTVLKNFSWSDASENTVNLINFFQRITGLTAFILISIQIIMGHWMNKWTQIVGSKAYIWHVTQGIFTYLLVLIHPFLYALITYEISKSFLDSIMVVIPRLSSQTEIYLTYGKFSFVLITLTVVAGYFRTKPFFRRNWLKLHALNYFLFYSMFLHMRIGTDVTTPPFVWVSWAALILVSYSAFERFVYPFVREYIPKRENEIAKEKR